MPLTTRNFAADPLAMAEMPRRCGLCRYFNRGDVAAQDARSRARFGSCSAFGWPLGPIAKAAPSGPALDTSIEDALAAAWNTEPARFVVGDLFGCVAFAARV